MKNKKEMAEWILKYAKESGIRVTLEGKFIKFEPPLPVQMQIDSADCNKDLFAILNENPN